MKSLEAALSDAGGVTLTDICKSHTLTTSYSEARRVEVQPLSRSHTVGGAGQSERGGSARQNCPGEKKVSDFLCFFLEGVVSRCSCFV